MENEAVRMVRDIQYPNLCYLQAFVLFVGGNLFYHKHIFKRNGKALNFSAFLLVNVFTSFQVAELTNPFVIKYYAQHHNNVLEAEHRKEMNFLLRNRFFGHAK